MTIFRKPTTVVLLLLVLAAFAISTLSKHPHWLSQLTYAVEKGRAQSAEEQLSVATDLSQAFELVAQALRPSVVTISTIKRIQPRQGSMRRMPGDIPEEFRGFFFDDEFFRNFGDAVPRRGLEQTGLGSGVIVSEDGYILTNNHVVGDADEVNVILFDDREFKAELVGRDQPTDLAVLKIDAQNLKPAKLGDSSVLKVGQWVLAIGSPFELDQTVTAGIISAKSRSGVGITEYEDFLQTDAAINPGNSGGPLVNLKAEVIGINTAIASRTGGYMGVGFAIPSGMARYVFDSILKEGRVNRGWLGAVIQPLNEDLAQSFGYKSTAGVLIGDVVPDGPAAKSGLQSGDIVQQLNGKPVAEPNELRNAVAALAPNSRARLQVFRDGRTQTLEVVIGQREDDAQAQTGRPGLAATAELGLTVETLTPEIARQLELERGVRGVVVTEIEPGSMADRAGVSPGSVILSVNGVSVASAADFRKAMQAGDPQQGIRLYVWTEGVKRFVFLRESR